MTINEVKEVAEQLYELMRTTSYSSKSKALNEWLFAGVIYGACEYALEFDCIDELKFKVFIERLRRSAVNKYMYNIVEAFTVPANRLALHINKDVIVSTIVEHRMRNEL